MNKRDGYEKRVVHILCFKLKSRIKLAIKVHRNVRVYWLWWKMSFAKRKSKRRAASEVLLRTLVAHEAVVVFNREHQPILIFVQVHGFHHRGFVFGENLEIRERIR